ncbi:PREDICTED: uncharacterized protein LOC107065870 [Polistes dominula]|uniref:Uncharacterized protein LOC107065870 n=1 Tax=Polistes dominula TaxID=743375 RepID=A0ABM1I5C8_POLDO|nr:PREDICTED: uncharacterized protein LOC107065870 [Polistes dominula]
MDNEKESELSRDRRYRSVRAYRSNATPIEKLENLRQAWRLIWDLENYGPAGLIHLAALAYVTGAPIRIWGSGHELMQTIGENERGTPIDIEYHTNNQEGHWTFRGRGQPENIHHDLNNCLFSVIAEQTGINASELRQETIKQLKRNVRLLADYMNEIKWLEKNNKIVLLIGGARYTGTTPEDAKVILDESDNKECFEYNVLGHPRKHAVGSSGFTNCTESDQKFKSVFLSSDDQDLAAHIALSSPAAQEAMQKLNKGSKTEVVHIMLKDVNDPRLALQKGKFFNECKEVSNEKDIKKLVLVLRHHKGRETDPDAPVFVQTFYPVLKKKKKKH